MRPTGSSATAVPLSLPHALARSGRAFAAHAIRARPEEGGIGILLVLVALSILSLLGLYAGLTATTEIRISDNHESYLRARQASLAGIAHARELLRGLSFDEVLSGPDGVFDSSPAGTAAARTHAFRNPVSWLLASSLDVADPGPALRSLADDGILNTGRHGSGSGLALIPVVGIPQMAPDASGAGVVVLSRYFVKATDNNGEGSEIAADPADNPFHDGDGILIVRSLGVARTIREDARLRARQNSVSIFESRFRRKTTFDLDAPLLIEASDVVPADVSMFVGDSFLIEGSDAIPGIGFTAPDPGTGAAIAASVESQLAGAQADRIRGAGLVPSLREVTGTMLQQPDKSLLLDGRELRDWVRRSAPRFADTVLTGTQDWTTAAAPFLGSWNPALPGGAPGQDPRVTLVNGDLVAGGGVAGAGVLIVTGGLTIRGSFSFHGLIVAAGAGELRIDSAAPGIQGGILLASLVESAAGVRWGDARLTVSGPSVIRYDAAALRMAIRLMPVSQVSFREITRSLDP